MKLFSSIAAAAVIGASFTVLATPKANACAGGNLDRYKVGSSLNQIVNEMNGACPSTISIHAGMNWKAVCESARGSKPKIFFIENGKVSSYIVIGKEDGRDYYYQVRPFVIEAAEKTGRTNWDLWC